MKIKGKGIADLLILCVFAVGCQSAPEEVKLIDAATEALLGRPEIRISTTQSTSSAGAENIDAVDQYNIVIRTQDSRITYYEESSDAKNYSFAMKYEDGKYYANASGPHTGQWVEQEAPEASSGMLSFVTEALSDYQFESVTQSTNGERTVYALERMVPDGSPADYEQYTYEYTLGPHQELLKKVLMVQYNGTDTFYEVRMEMVVLPEGNVP